MALAGLLVLKGNYLMDQNPINPISSKSKSKTSHSIKKQFRSLKKAGKELAVFASYMFARELCNDPFSDADKQLRDFHPAPDSSALIHNELSVPEYDLMIIVPAYNVEKWIETCIGSILDQITSYSFLIKIIDDGSTDGTSRIVDQYANDSRIQIIHQENRGYSGARNRGLAQINSRYIMFVDSDDYLLPGAIEKLMNEAVGDDIDIVEGNGYRFNNKKRIGLIKPAGFQDMMGGPWMKVYKSKLFESVGFPDEYMYEDKIISALVLQLTDKKRIIPDEVYAYRIHPESITQKHDDDPRRLDSYWIMWLMQKEQQKLGIPVNDINYYHAMKQAIMTYRRTICFPEEIKKAIFVGTKHFLETYYSLYLDRNDKCQRLANAIMNDQYGKYKVFCENYMI